MTKNIIITLIVLFITTKSAITINYPIRLTYIDTINAWWPPTAIAAQLAVPGYATKTNYNYVVFCFWLSHGPADIVLLWSNITYYFGTDSVFGKTNLQIQTNIKKLYNDAGIKLMISAFGSTDFPTTGGRDPVKVATDLANFVLNNNLDGVDIDWQDNPAMQNGSGFLWLVTFTKKLRELLPKHIITHAPQAPYFNSQIYKGASYTQINNQVGNMINFYNVQFYNQGNTAYDTYKTLFKKSDGYFPLTSVKQIIASGVPSRKVVVGKPATAQDVSNTGYVDASLLGNWTGQAYIDFKWYAGVMFWQYRSDLNGYIVGNATSNLMGSCLKNGNCT